MGRAIHLQAEEKRCNPRDDGVHEQEAHVLQDSRQACANNLPSLAREKLVLRATQCFPDNANNVRSREKDCDIRGVRKMHEKCKTPWRCHRSMIQSRCIYPPSMSTYLEVREHVQRHLVVRDKRPDWCKELPESLSDDERYENGDEKLDEHIDGVELHIHASQE